MAAYVISEVQILDETLADPYRALSAVSIAEYGGRYLVRGAEADVVEGTPTTRRFVTVEFASIERARAWYDSSAYTEALKLRRTALDRRLIFVDGVTAATGTTPQDRSRPRSSHGYDDTSLPPLPALTTCRSSTSRMALSALGVGSLRDSYAV